MLQRTNWNWSATIFIPELCPALISTSNLYSHHLISKCQLLQFAVTGHDQLVYYHGYDEPLIGAEYCLFKEWSMNSVLKCNTCVNASFKARCAFWLWIAHVLKIYVCGKWTALQFIYDNSCLDSDMNWVSTQGVMHRVTSSEKIFVHISLFGLATHMHCWWLAVDKLTSISTITAELLFSGFD